MKKIFVEHGKRQDLMRIFRCTYPTVRAALNYKSSSKKACKIRKAAMEMGGVEVNNELRIKN